MNNKDVVAKAVYDVVKEDLTLEEVEKLLENPKSADHGDVAFPAFSLAKIYRKAPQQIAADLAEKIDSTNFEKIEVVGPYLNFFMNKAVISKDVLASVVKEKEHYGDSTIGNNGSVPIDMSSPNIAKPISMGHLRSTVIGNSIGFIMEKLGYQPIRINHLGDWGTQFGKLIVAYKKWGSEEAVKSEPINELLRLYVQFHEVAETEPELNDEARSWFKRLEEGDKEAIELWQWFRDESMKEFNKIYDLLEVRFDSLNGEAFYNDKMDEIVELLEEKHLLNACANLIACFAMIEGSYFSPADSTVSGYFWISFTTSQLFSSSNAYVCSSDGLNPAFSIKLMARACVYCTYGPVSPSKRTTSSRLKSKVFKRSFFKSWKITAPTPTCLATTSLFARSGFFSLICSFAD